MLEQSQDPAVVAQTLADAGCPPDFIDKYLRVMESGSPQEQRRLLDCQRCHVLEGVHAEQRKLDCLDHLRYQLKRETETKRER